MTYSPYLKWTIAGLIGLIIFGNHYARDTLGALEKQIELDLHETPKQYALLNSFYFLPNIITPFIGGVVAQRLGASKCLILSLVLTVFGHIVFIYGAL